MKLLIWVRKLKKLLNKNKMDNKETIIRIFKENVKGKSSDTSEANVKHDGKEGHWLEKQFGVNHNADNKSDLLGYELKNQTNSKTTFGDWSANYYIFMDSEYFDIFLGNTKKDRQSIFLRIFGKPNPLKNGRYSWSGEPSPKIGIFNNFGQKLEITEEQDIVVIYDYNEDKRVDKEEIIPEKLKKRIIIAKWFGKNSPSEKRTDKSLKSKVEDKFNDNGWFTCKKGPDGKYEEICFGEPINFESWIKLVEKGIVFFDSGMYEGNPRPYSQWRANNSLWESLIVERYK